MKLSILRNVSPDGDVVPKTYRVQRVFAKGFENHKLILICLDDAGYWSLHYNEKGHLVETIYVRFRVPDEPGTHEGPSLPLREAALDGRRENPPSNSAGPIIPESKGDGDS